MCEQPEHQTELRFLSIFVVLCMYMCLCGFLQYAHFQNPYLSSLLVSLLFSSTVTHCFSHDIKIFNDSALLGGWGIVMTLLVPMRPHKDLPFRSPSTVVLRTILSKSSNPVCSLGIETGNMSCHFSRVAKRFRVKIELE